MNATKKEAKRQAVGEFRRVKAWFVERGDTLGEWATRAGYSRQMAYWSVLNPDSGKTKAESIRRALKRQMGG